MAVRTRASLRVAAQTLAVVVIGLLAIHAGVTLVRALQPRSPAPRPAHLMPAAGGPLRDLAIQFHRTGSERFLPVMTALLDDLSPTTTVHVVVADDEDRRIFEEARRGRGRVVYTVAGRPITSWMRDRLAVLDGGDPGITLLSPRRPQTGPAPRVHDWLVPWRLREHLGARARLRVAPFRFDGGDLIGDGDRAYVATPIFGRNPEVQPAALVAALERELGLPVLRLGTDAPVPDHHIGMFLTPLGGGRVAYGDPDLGRDALRAAGLLRDGRSAALQVDGEPLSLDLSEPTLDRFRNVGRELRAGGFTAVPIPIVLSSEPFVFLSYNNVLMEHRSGRLHVYLPVYGVDPLDTAATRAWQEQGAVVHPVHVEGIFRLGGSVRCLVAPLARG